MKTIMLLAIASALLVCPTVKAADDFGQVETAIHTLQPDLEPSEVATIARAVREHAEARRIDWKLLLAVLFQESSLHRDPQDCLSKKLACADLGIGQVNWRTWAKPLNLSKVRLVTDTHYSIGTAASILAQYRDRYESKDRYWIGRYNSATPEYRKDYQKKVLRHYVKIKASLLMGYAYGRIRQFENGHSYGRRQAFLYAGGGHDPLYPVYGPYREVCGALPTESRNGLEVRPSRQVG